MCTVHVLSKLKKYLSIGNGYRNIIYTYKTQLFLYRKLSIIYVNFFVSIYSTPKPSHYILSTKTTSTDSIDDKAAAMINELKVSGISTFTHYGSKTTRLSDVQELTEEDNTIDYENQCIRYF